MSTPEHAIKYITGGTVQAGDGVYVERAADGVLLEVCRKGEFAYVLTSRQMGKSSLMIRTAERLMDEGVKAVIVDLTNLGAKTTAEQWYLGLLQNIAEQLELRTKVEPWWNVNQHLSIALRFNQFMAGVVLQEVRAPVVIFVDEIDTTLRLDFTDDFFASIRYLYNARANRKELTRLSFVLLGVASPTDLMKDPERTPFNIGHRVDLQDFTEEEAARDLHAEPDLVRSVFRYTSGHPYLTLRVFRSLSEQQLSSGFEARIDALFYGDQAEKDSNLQFVRDMLTKWAPDREAVLLRYRDVWKKKQVTDEEADQVCAWLRLSGIVRSVSGLLEVRNLIYRRVFDLPWIRRSRKINWPRRAAFGAAVAVGLLVLVAAILAPFALWQSKKAVALRDLSIARGLTSQAALLQASDPASLAQADYLALRSIGYSPSLDAQQILQSNVLLLRKLDATYPAKPPVLALAFTSDDKRMISYGHELSVQDLSSAPTQPTTDRATLPHTDFAATISASGKLWALADFDGITLSDVALKKALWKSPGLATDFIAIAFSPDDRSLLWITPGADKRSNRLHVFDLSRMKSAEPVTPPGSYDLPAFSRDGARVAFAKSGGLEVAIFETSTWKQIGSMRQASVVSAVALDATKRIVATGDRDGIIRLSDQHGEQLRQFSHRGAITSLSFNSDGSLLLSASEDKTARVWDTSSGAELARFFADAAVTRAVFSHDGQRIATAANDIRLWQLRTSLNAWQSVGAGTIEGLAFSPDAKYVIGGATDGYLHKWSTDTGTEIFRLELDHPFPQLSAVTFSPKGHLIGVAANPENNATGASGIVKILNSEGKPLREIKPQGHLLSLEFSPDERSLIAGTGTAGALLIDFASGAVAEKFGITTVVRSASFSPDGSRIVTGSWDGFVRVWEVRTGKVIWEVRNPGRSGTAGVVGIMEVHFSLDGRRIVAAGGADKNAIVLDAASGRVSLSLPHGGFVIAASFSRDGSVIVTGERDTGAVHVWDAFQGAEITRLVYGSDLWRLCLSPSMDRLAISGSAGLQIRPWKPQEVLSYTCDLVPPKLSLPETAKVLLGGEAGKPVCPSMPQVISETAIPAPRSR